METFRNITINRLKKLKYNLLQIAFAYSICFRMLPNYLFFVKNESWGDKLVLINALDSIKSYILNKEYKVEKTLILSEIYKNIPNSDTYSSVLATYGQMAASAVYYTINSIYKTNISELSWVPVLSRDTVDLFIQDKEQIEYDEFFENKIYNHVSMQKELEKQENDYKLLLKSKEITPEVIGLLIGSYGKDSNIGIPNLA